MKLEQDSRPRSEETNYAVRAVSRALDLLDAVRSAPDGVSLAKLVKVVQLPKSSVFRYLATLEARGYVEKDPVTGDYRLGFAFSPLQESRLELLSSIALPRLRRLRDRSEETANLGVLQGNKVAYLQILESPLAIRFAAQPGHTDPIHSTAMGKAMGATYLDERRVRRVLATEGMLPRTSRTITDPDAFLRELETVRKQGYAVDWGENEDGGCCIGVAVSGCRIPAAISLSLPESRFSEERVGKLATSLKRVADQLEKEFRRADV
jgi:IclR family transcriptional regulator, acetate operon repressor